METPDELKLSAVAAPDAASEEQEEIIDLTDIIKPGEVLLDNSPVPEAESPAEPDGSPLPSAVSPEEASPENVLSVADIQQQMRSAAAQIEEELEEDQAAPTEEASLPQNADTAEEEEEDMPSSVGSERSREQLIPEQYELPLETPEEPEEEELPEVLVPDTLPESQEEPEDSSVSPLPEEEHAVTEDPETEAQNAAEETEASAEILPEVAEEKSSEEEKEAVIQAAPAVFAAGAALNAANMLKDMPAAAAPQDAPAFDKDEIMNSINTTGDTVLALAMERIAEVEDKLKEQDCRLGIELLNHRLDDMEARMEELAAVLQGRPEGNAALPADTPDYGPALEELSHRLDLLDTRFIALAESIHGEEEKKAEKPVVDESMLAQVVRHELRDENNTPPYVEGMVGELVNFENRLVALEQHQHMLEHNSEKTAATVAARIIREEINAMLARMGQQR